MYQMKCMNPLHPSLTDKLSDPNQTSKMLVVIQIQTVRHTILLMVLDGTLSLDWPQS